MRKGAKLARPFKGIKNPLDISPEIEYASII